VGGFRSLKPSFTITKTEFSPNKSLPTAATCFNILKLPDYKEKELFRKNVMIAILHGSEGFSFL
jgi:ubiquitin-protein ligase E3 C